MVVETMSENINQFGGSAKKFYGVSIVDQTDRAILNSRHLFIC